MLNKIFRINKFALIFLIAVYGFFYASNTEAQSSATIYKSQIFTYSSLFNKCVMFGDGAGTIFSDKGSAQDATMASLKNCLGKNGYQQKNTLNWGRGYFIYNCYGIFPNGGDEYWVKSCATGTSAADATGNVHYAFWKAVNRPEQVSFTDNVCWNGRCGIPFTTSYLTYQTINYSVDVKIVIIHS